MSDRKLGFGRRRRVRGAGSAIGDHRARRQAVAHHRLRRAKDWPACRALRRDSQALFVTHTHFDHVGGFEKLFVSAYCST